MAINLAIYAYITSLLLYIALEQKSIEIGDVSWVILVPISHVEQYNHAQNTWSQ